MMMFPVFKLVFEIVQAIIEANLIGPLVQLLQNAEFEIKKEAAWAISNDTSGGTNEQIKYIFLFFISHFILALSLINNLSRLRIPRPTCSLRKQQAVQAQKTWSKWCK